mgnify:CR=1 FL=1
MVIKPTSVEECLYFTNRTIDSGRTIAWVFRKECPKCKKGFMSKPQKKGSKIDKKATYYICNSCGYQESNEQLENNLIINIEYKCPYCGDEGETTSEYKRKNFYGVKAYVFECQKCHKKIGLTKKMKEAKKGTEDKSDIDE